MINYQKDLFWLRIWKLIFSTVFDAVFIIVLFPSKIWSFYLSLFHSWGWCDGNWNQNMQLIVLVCLAITYKFIDVLIHLPFGAYETFKIKKKHGFSEATCCRFLVERLFMLLEFIIVPLTAILLFAKIV